MNVTPGVSIVCTIEYISLSESNFSLKYWDTWNYFTEKHLQKPCNITETHWSSSNKDIFQFIRIILRVSNYFIMLIFENPYFMLFPKPGVVSSYIDLINLLSKLSFYFFVYLSLLNCSGINVSFFCSLIIRLSYLLAIFIDVYLLIVLDTVA